MKYSRLLLLLLALGQSSAVMASDKHEALLTERFYQQIPAATTNSFFLAPLDLVELDIQPDKQNATISLANTVSTSDGRGRGKFTNWAVEVKVPVNEDDQLGRFLNTDGLANAKSLTFKWQMANVSGLNTPTRSLSERKLDICASLGWKPEGDVECDWAFISNESVTSDKPELISAYYDTIFAQRPTQTIFGFEASIGDKSYTFFNPSDLAKQDITETPWSVGAYASILPDSMNGMFLSIGYEYQKFFEAADAATQCKTQPNENNALDCISGSIGAPTEQTNELLTFEARKKLTILGAQRAAALTLKYDFEDEVASLDLPIYLTTDKEGKLSGGVRFAWNDDDKDLELGVFIGSRFSLTN